MNDGNGLKSTIIVVIAGTLVVLFTGVAVGYKAYSIIESKWREDISVHDDVPMHDGASAILVNVQSEIRKLREALIAKGVIDPY